MDNSVKPGKILNNRYCLLHDLGHGGFGRSYLAEDIDRFNQLCILKEFAPQIQSSEALRKAEELLARETEVLSKLKHSQIRGFRELFRLQQEGNRCLFLVQDYVEGQTYQALLKSRRNQKRGFSEPEVTQLLWQILPVLEYIHSMGVIHRDISPDNLILRSCDRLPVLIDFGGIKQVAATLESESIQADPVTAKSEIVAQLGKAGYAPEQQIHRGIAFAHSDLYALAVTILVLLTGKEPRQAIDPKTLKWDWKREIPLNPKLTRVLAKMLAKQPGDRFQSAREVMQALSKTPLQLPNYPVTQHSKTQVTLAIAPLNMKSEWKNSQPENQGYTPSASRENRDFWIRSNLPPRNAQSNSSPTTAIAKKSMGKPIPSKVDPIVTPSPSSQRDDRSGRRSIVKTTDNSGQLTTYAKSQNLQAWDELNPSSFSRTGNPLLGWLGKIFFVVIIIAASSAIGWFAGKSWLDQVERQGNNPDAQNGLPSPQIDKQKPESPSQLSEQESQSKAALRTRRLNLGINYNFFVKLVDQVFSNQYPSQKGRILTSKPEEERWDAIAAELLEKLSFLSPEALREMGGYNQQQRDRWKQQVNKLHLSSRALYDLADAEFFYRFREQENQRFIDQPMGQVWSAIVFDKLKALKSGEAYERIVFSPNASEKKLSGTLKPGEGKAYIARLSASGLMDVKLEADQETLLSIYTPTGKAKILEDSKMGQWSGRLPEKGFYEFIIVSKATKPLNYQLTLTVNNSQLTINN